MLKSLELFQSAQTMARHSAQQQAVIAENIANADTPGFRAMTLPQLESHPPQSAQTSISRASRAMHFDLDTVSSQQTAVIDRDGEMSPNGNTVSVESEIMKSIEAERNHARAMTVYQSALSILRTSIGRGR